MWGIGLVSVGNFIFSGFLVSFIGSIFSNAIAYWLIKRGFNILKVIRTTTYIVATLMAIAILSLSLLIVGMFNLAGWLGILIFVIVFGIQYLIHPYLLLQGEGVRRPMGEETRLLDMLEDLKKGQGISMKIDLYVAESDIPNAFAIGNAFKKAIVVNKGLLKVLSDEEIKAVLAHELGHIVHKDNAYALATSLVPYIAYIIGFAFIVGGFLITQASLAATRSSRDEAQQLGLFTSMLGLLIMMLGFILTILSFIVNASVMAFSRLREHLADIYSVKALGNTKIAQALLSLENTVNHLRSQKKGFEEAKPSIKKMLYIVPTLHQEEVLTKTPSVLRWITVFSTHPPTEARIFVAQRYYQDLCTSRGYSARGDHVQDKICSSM